MKRTYGPKEKKNCIYCQGEFIDAKYSHNRVVCLSPECAEKYRADERVKWSARQKAKRQAARAGKPLAVRKKEPKVNLEPIPGFNRSKIFGIVPVGCTTHTYRQFLDQITPEQAALYLERRRAWDAKRDRSTRNLFFVDENGVKWRDSEIFGRVPVGCTADNYREFRHLLMPEQLENYRTRKNEMRRNQWAAKHGARSAKTPKAPREPRPKATPLPAILKPVKQPKLTEPKPGQAPLDLTKPTFIPNHFPAPAKAPTVSANLATVRNGRIFHKFAPPGEFWGGNG